MKTTVQRRLARLAGLLLLTLLVFATGVQAAQAALVAGAGVGSDSASFTAPARLQGLTPTAQSANQPGVAVSGTRVATSARTQGRGGITLAPLAASGVRPASSGTSSTTAWIVAGSAAALLIVIVAAWVLIRRRQPGELASATYCAQHPEDSLCAAA